MKIVPHGYLAIFDDSRSSCLQVCLHRLGLMGVQLSAVPLSESYITPLPPF